jgi:glucosamine-6-phosphate deaminase
MNYLTFPTKQEMARAAAEAGAAYIRRAIADRGQANIVVGTGASQVEMFETLIALPQIAWNRVTVFHLDEYVGIPITHPASFRLFLWQRFVSRLTLPLAACHYIDGEGDCRAEMERVGAILRRRPIDVAFVGIGENGHLAFNDPPADFETDEPFLLVDLDEACRRQQFSEGWFPTLDDVFRKAISMSVRQIMRSAAIICTVPDQRKARAARNAIEGPVTPEVPASILQEHPEATIFLDPAAASLLSPRT